MIDYKNFVFILILIKNFHPFQQVHIIITDMMIIIKVHIKTINQVCGMLLEINMHVRKNPMGMKKKMIQANKSQHAASQQLTPHSQHPK